MGKKLVQLGPTCFKSSGKTNTSCQLNLNFYVVHNGMIIAHYHRARWPEWRGGEHGFVQEVSRVVGAKHRQRTELLCPRDTQLIMVKEKCTFLFLKLFSLLHFFIALFCVCADQFPFFFSTPKVCVCFKEEFLGLISP